MKKSHEKNALIVPLFFQNFSGYDCDLFFETFSDNATEENSGVNREDFVAELSIRKLHNLEKRVLKIIYF